MTLQQCGGFKNYVCVYLSLGLAFLHTGINLDYSYCMLMIVIAMHNVLVINFIDCRHGIVMSCYRRSTGPDGKKQVIL